MLPGGARPARPLAVRATSSARRVVSKPGQAPQASRRPLGAHCCSGCPPHRHALVAGSIPARPRRRPQAPHPGPAGLAPPTGRPLLFRVPSTPARSRRREYPSQVPPPPTGTTTRPHRPHRGPQAPQPGPTGPTAAHRHRNQAYLHAHTRKAVAAQDTSTPRPATASSMKRQMS